MYRKIEDFKKEWTFETEETVKLFSTLTDESLAQKVSEDGRELGYIAWHIVISLSEMINKTGLSVEAVDENSDHPQSAKVILDEFKKCADSVLKNVTDNWKDEDLLTTVNMYGEEWTKGATLWILVKHQVHHRGQITVLMRQAGVGVHGVYGPSKEEWAAYGAPPAK